MLEPLQGGTMPPAIHPLEYRQILEGADVPDRPQRVGAPVPAAEELAERVQELESEIRQRSRSYKADLETARREAHEQGRVSERDEQAAGIERAEQQLSKALKEFAAERDRYLAEVEQEVVRLALAIAARILHREAQMDPLLLAGAVRVALGQLADTTGVRLVIPALEQEMWSEMLRLMPNLPLRPELIAEETLAAGECRIETHLGNIDLGVRSQLEEIERGFFDLLEKRGGSGLKAQEEIRKREREPGEGN